MIPIIDLPAAKKKSRSMLGKIFGVVVSVYILMALALFSKPINSMDRTLAAATIESRKPKEGLWYSKAKLMVGKSYNLRVVVCE